MKRQPAAALLVLATVALPLVLSPPCRATLSDNGDGTVTQTRADGTRLMWLQDANQASTSGYFAYVTVDEYCATANPASCFPITPQVGLSHAEAAVWASSLDFAGHTDWRVASGLNPDGSGPFVGFYAQGATGEMLDLSATEGVWRDAPGPCSNMQLSYWTESSGVDPDDGIWDMLFMANSQAILQSKLVVVGPDAQVDRRFPAWAVRDLPPLEPPASVPALSAGPLFALCGFLAVAAFAQRGRGRKPRGPERRRSSARWVLVLAALIGSSGEASASHFRYSHITWRPTGNAGEVVFTVSSAFRRGAPGTHPLSYPGSATDGGLAVGDTFSEYIGATRLFYGDGGSTLTLTYQVDAINTVEDWIVAHAINPATGSEWRHTYVGTGPFTAGIDSCCRTAVELNNPNKSYKVSTIVDLSVANSSPVSSVPPIVPCPQGACILPLPAVDVDVDALNFRLSTPTEASSFGFVQPGAGTADPLAIGGAGLLAWDSSNFPKGLYSTSVTLEESRAGPLGKVMLDFLINTDTFLGAAPHFVVPPTPVNAQVFSSTGGNLFSVTIQCADADAGDLVTLGHLGLPAGATLSPASAIGNPATASFNWTPIATQAVTVGLTCVDSLGNQALPHSFSMLVTGILVPPGPDRDNDLFCDGFSINQLIAGWNGVYNVIDNSLQASAVLVGTSGPDLILASGLGDQMFGLGGDDCIIGADANDYASGGDGDDSIWGWSGDDVLEGDADADELDGRDGNDFLLGGSGNDVIRGWDNEDWMRGGAGDDVLYGGDDIDGMDGDAGDDQLFAGAGEDVLAGGTGSDTLDGGVGADVCVDDGVDTLIGCLVTRPQNTAPRFSPPIGDLLTDESTPLSLTIVAVDPDPPGLPEQGGVLTFSSLNLPLFATLTDNLDRTATLDIVPLAGDAGSYPGIIIKVTDDLEPFQVDVEVVDLTVTGGNLPPSLSAIGSHVLVENESLSLLITGSDLDPGDTLTFVGTGLPPFVTLTDHGDRSATLDIQPGTGDAAQYHGIQVRVVDDGTPIMDDSEIFSIIVSSSPNAPPVITTPVNSPTLQVGTSLAIPLVAIDADPGDVLTWTSINLPAFATLTDLGGGAALIQLQPIAGDEGSYVANVVEVADDGTPPLTDAEVFTISVTTTPPANSPPVITTPVGSPSLTVGQSLGIPLAANDPNVGDLLSWSSPSLPAFATLTDLGGGSAQLDIQPLAGDVGTYAGNMVAATDDGSPPLADAEVFIISVPEPGSLVSLVAGIGFLWAVRGRRGKP